MKKITILVFALVAVFLVTSCGGGGSQSGSTTEAKKVEKPTPNLENGKIVYEKACIACHMAGVGGAAKLDDKARWAASAAKGFETLQKTVIKGVAAGEGKYGVMAPRGACADCSDKDIYDAVGYVLKQAGVTAE